jgi:hypothetical protein
MNPIVKNILILVGALIVGSIVNMGVIMLSGSMIPPPAGVDPNDVESIRANIHLYEAKHFIFPFLAHAIGTLVAAFIVAKFVTGKKIIWVGLVGVLFLAGGITAATMIPAPTWFVVVDLILAYLPMAWLGSKFAKGSK